MVTQYNAWTCPTCGARVTDLARPEALVPEHRVCERCWRRAVRIAAALLREPAPCDVCGRVPAVRCEHGQIVLCDACRDTDEHREYCEMIQDGGAE